MPKEDSLPGLLSKVVKFVRNPATSWADLDNKGTDREEALSKQLLKEMIERKRRNDFVRKREFDMLRKMRKREALVGQDQSARPSFFQSSMPSKPDDRANTLKKIDEIEAQMSMQWWKTKHGNSSLDSISGAAYSLARQPASGNQISEAQPADYAITQPGELLPPAGSGVGQGSFGTAARMPQQPLAGNAPIQPVKIDGLSSQRVTDDHASTGFTLSRTMAVDVAEVTHDAELEEASIRFANGDDIGAEAGLREMLSPAGSRVGSSETWMALFDLYRATAQQDKFETAALQFVEIFSRSAPLWFSMPDMVQKLANAEAKVSGHGPAADWICPSVIGIQTVAALKAALTKAPMPWRLDWSHLKTIDVVALDALCKVFGSWSAQPVQLRFMGDAQLEQVLLRATPSGNSETAQAWWKLRMEAARVTHRPDEFELAALDFCVTYEVSPPAWESARCEYKALDHDGSALTGHTFIGDVSRDSVLSGLSMMDGDTQMDGMSSQMSHLVSVELSGQVQGDAIAVLDQLDAKLVGADIMVISCTKLVRVDFSAAGTLLNWVSARQAENRQVQFTEVNRLVAAFFNVIGIAEHARVLTRCD